MVDKTKDYLGKGNPNFSFAYPDDLLENIDSEFKAYVLGWIASDGTVQDDKVTIQIHQKDIDVLHSIREYLNQPPEFVKLYENKEQCAISFCRKKISQDVRRHLNLTEGKKAFTVEFPEIPKEFDRHFIRGVFDGDGHISNPYENQKNYPTGGISSSSKNLLDKIRERLEGIAKVSQTKDKLEFSHNNCLDFLGFIYDDCSFKLERKSDLYDLWSNWVPSVTGRVSPTKTVTRWAKTRLDAVYPRKVRASDSGYDLTLLDKDKSLGNLYYFNTGIKIQPDFGWYFDLVPRSSLTKTGYILANSVGIIDRSYVGELKVSLIKIDPEAPELELPGRYVQLVPRPIVNVEFVLVEDLDDTGRGDGGFGSTGK